jgi:hypothetical protein
MTGKRDPVSVKTVMKEVLMDLYCRRLLPKWAAQRVYDFLKLKEK